MRKIAIINTHDVDITNNIINHFKNEEIYVFQSSKIKNKSLENVKVENISDDILNSTSKIKNYVMKYFYDNKKDGFLHVIQDDVEILKDPSIFFVEIEKMMTMLNQKSWFNTINDVCNYTFKIYNPRFSLEIDEEEYKKLYDKTIYFTSHANPTWACYDLTNSTYEDNKFDDRFSVPMLYIIKFLAERRNNKKNGELYFMNFYPTIEDEKGLFKNIQIVEKDEVITQEIYKKENSLFESLCVNFEADKSVEPVITAVYDILTEKLKK